MEGRIIHTSARIEEKANAELYARMLIRKALETSSWAVSKRSSGSGGGDGNVSETFPLLQQKEYFGFDMEESARSAIQALA